MNENAKILKRPHRILFASNFCSLLFVHLLHICRTDQQCFQMNEWKDLLCYFSIKHFRTAFIYIMLQNQINWNKSFNLIFVCFWFKWFVIIYKESCERENEVWDIGEICRFVWRLFRKLLIWYTYILNLL